MALVKINDYSFSNEGKQLTVKLRVKTSDLLVPSSTASTVFKHIYLDNQETWPITDLHDIQKGSGDLVDLIVSHTVVGEFTEYTLVISFNYPESSETEYRTKQFKYTDFLILSVEINLNAFTPAAIVTGACSDYIVKFPMYDLLKLRLSALNDAKSIVYDCDKCEIPRCFITKVLLIDSIELFVKCGYLYKAVVAFNKFFKGKTNTSKASIKSCGCHGN